MPFRTSLGSATANPAASDSTNGHPQHSVALCVSCSPRSLASCAGTRLGSTCWPDSFTDLLDVVTAYMPTINRPLTFVFVSKTSPTLMGASSWLLDMQAPGAVPVQPLGVMPHWPDCPLTADNTTYYAYRLVVPGRSLVSVSVQSCCWRGLAGSA
jgi:hypothetical protein